MAPTSVDVDRNVRRVVQLLMTAGEVEPTDVAAHLGLGRSSFYERLNGKRRFTVQELAKLADYFSVAPGTFFVDPRELLASSSSLSRATGVSRVLAGQAA